MIAGQLLRRWSRGDFLAARLTGESLFPLELKLKRPSARELAQHFGAAQDWVSALVDASRQGQGFGFDLRFQATRNRVQGVNELPVAAVFRRESDALRLIRRQADADWSTPIAGTPSWPCSIGSSAIRGRGSTCDNWTSPASTPSSSRPTEPC